MSTNQAESGRRKGKQGTNERRLSGCWKKLTLLLVTVSLCLVVLEVAVRMLTDVIPPVLVRHPVLGKTYRPHFDDRVWVPEAGREVRLRFNREGFRGPDVSEEKGEDVFRIAVIGDSFVAAVGVDEEQTAVRQLERMLNSSHPDRTWQVQNFGVSSSSTGQEYVLYRELVARYEPDVVVLVYSTLNDFTDNSSEMTTQSRIRFAVDDSGNLVREPMSVGRSAVTRWLQLHSRLYIWQKQLSDVVKHKAKDAIRPLSTESWIYSNEPSEQLRRVWLLNTRLLEAFHEEVEARGSRFVLVVLPNANSVYDDLWNGVLTSAGEHRESFRRDHPELRLSAIAGERGFDAVLMASEFRQATAGLSLSKTDPADWLFLNGTDHLNENGNSLVARILYRFLTNSGESLPADAELSYSPEPESF